MGANIVIRQLSKQYDPPRGPVAIRDLDLEIQQGEILSLLGPNGAGKTTLIGILCGLLPPSSGEAIVAGYNVLRDPVAVKKVIGVVPEEIALYPNLSAQQNLRYFGLLYGLDGHQLDAAIAKALAVTRLVDRAGDRVAHFSGGMKRRLNVAVGLLHTPRILLMDEPTLGLDPSSRRSILDLVLQIRRDHGTTILYTTHYMEEAQELSDRVAIIHQGRIMALGPPEEMIRELHGEDVLRLYLSQVTIPAGMLDALREVRGVRQVFLEGDGLSLTLLNAGEVLSEILNIIADAGIGVRSLTVQQPNLETVFLHLTNQRLTVAPP
jgi:ABC-2 type transport system ATP-binding protein